MCMIPSANTTHDTTMRVCSVLATLYLLRNMQSASAVEKISQPSKKRNFTVENIGFGIHFVCLCLDENLLHEICMSTY